MGVIFTKMVLAAPLNSLIHYLAGQLKKKRVRKHGAYKTL
jgi:hypothetical protein